MSRLGDRTAAVDFIADRVAAGAYGQADNPALAEVLTGSPATRAGKLLSAVITGNARLKPAACAALLASCAAASKEDTQTLHPAALALLAALPGTPDQSEDLPPALHWRREPPSPGLVADTLTALGLIDPDLAARALAHFLSDTDRYPMDAILVPAAVALADGDESRAAE